MMDGDALYSERTHPVFTSFALNLSGELRSRWRVDVPIKYYFIDFGISTRFRKSDDSLVLGVAGRDQSVPELSSTEKYDPFKTDIYIIGNTLREEFYNVSQTVLDEAFD